MSDLLSDSKLKTQDIRHWLFHAGGKTILDAIQDSLKLEPSSLDASRRVLRKYGNMYSPTVLFVLEALMAEGTPKAGDRGLMASFGAGFSAHGAVLEWA